MLVIKPTLTECGRVMMLRCLQRLPLMVALENITENGAWFANCADGIPPILPDFTTNGSLIPSFFPFLPLIFSGPNQGKNPPEGDNGGSKTPTATITTTAASVTSDRTLSSRVGRLIAQYTTNTEDGQFVSFLADFKRALN
jgi:hypothetical protein